MAQQNFERAQEKRSGTNRSGERRGDEARPSLEKLIQHLDNHPRIKTMIARVWVWGLLALIVAAILVFVMMPATRALLIALSLCFVLVGIFPLTYLAYLHYRAPAQQQRLQDDFRLLGLAAESELEHVVSHLYQTIYSPSQFNAFIGLIVVLTLLICGAFIAEYPKAMGSFQHDNFAVALLSPAVTPTPIPTTIPAATTEGTADSEDASTQAQEQSQTETEAETQTETATLLPFFAFFGAYVFGVQELVRRYNTFDLLPQVYSSIFVRMVVAVTITYVAAMLVAGSVQDNFPMAYLVAFLIGVFPQRGMDWLRAKVSHVFDTRQPLSTVRPLTNLIGISPWHEARLVEMGLDDAQNLATVDIRRLLLTTKFDSQQIVHWIDQAILYVKVGDKIEQLRANYVSTFYELRRRISPSRDTRDLEADQAQVLDPILTLLAIPDGFDVSHIVDASNYPNFTHIAEYYARSGLVVQQRAELGTDAIFGPRLPHLAMDIQRNDTETDEKTLQKHIAQVNKLLENTPNDPKLLVAWGVHHQQLLKLVKNESEAKALIKQIGEYFDRAIDESPDYAEAYVRRAAYGLEQKRFDDTVRDCTRALTLAPALAVAYNYRGVAHVEMGYKELALDDFSQALSLKDSFAEAYMNRGTVYNAEGRFEEAIEDFQRAYYCGYRMPRLLANWGKALIGIGDDHGAMIKLSQAIANDSSIAMPFADRGYVYLRLDNYEDAMKDLQKAIVKDAQLFGAHVNLGEIFANQGKLTDALKSFQDALTIATTKPGADLAPIHLQLARTYFRNQQYQSAIDNFSRYLEKRPESVDVRLLRALAYQGNHDLAQAKKEIELVMQQTSLDAKQLTEVRAYLQVLEHAMQTSLHSSAEERSSPLNENGNGMTPAGVASPNGVSLDAATPHASASPAAPKDGKR